MTEQNKKYLYYGLGAIAAYLFVLKPILKNLGLERKISKIESNLNWYKNQK